MRNLTVSAIDRFLFVSLLLVLDTVVAPVWGEGPPEQPGIATAQAVGVAQASASGANPGSLGSADNFLFTGSFLYSLPFEVPPGLGGMQPEVSLQYNSGAGNGWVGVGWDLSLGTIQRSTKNGVPKYDNSDVFVVTLKGQTQELVKIADGSYRAKIEGAFQKFVIQSGMWIVTDKSGTRYFFGQTAASRLDSAAPAGTFLWALDKIIDRNNNTLTVTYTNPAGDNQLYPSEVQYTGNDTTGRVKDRKVVFLLENRSDVLSNYRAGFLMRTAKRLATIETYVSPSGSWQRVASYGFTYLTRADTNRSLLQRVTLTGYDGVVSQTIDLAKFDYPTDNRGWTTPIVQWALPKELSAGAAGNWVPTQAQLIDVNNDGLPDEIYSFEGGPHKTWINTASGFQDDPTWTVPVDFANANWVPNGAMFTELNGDGLPDIVYARQSYPPQAWRNTGAGWVQANQWALPHYLMAVGGSNPGTRLIDLNNDNRADFIMAHVPSGSTVSVRKTWINIGSGWNEQSNWAMPIDIGGTYPQYVDLNGDHLPDFVYAPDIGPKRTWINTGSGWSEQAAWALPEALVDMPSAGATIGTPINGAQFADVNGDGLPDFVVSQDISGMYHRTWINTGSGWSEQSNWAMPAGASLAVGVLTNGDTHGTFQDVNADGLVDFLISHNGNPAKTWLNTGNGWAGPIAALAVPDLLGINDCKWPGSQVLDINGDQLADFVIAYQMSYCKTHFSAGTPHADLIQSITNSLGGKVVIDYERSTVYTQNQLPFPIWVVKTLTKQDGVDASANTQATFSYQGGLFDYQEKEFLGFRQVSVTDALGNKSITYFHQKKNALGVDVPQNALKGRIERVEQYNAASQLLTTQETRWDWITPSTGVYFVRAAWVKNTLNEATPDIITQINYTYDDTPGGPGYGNVTQTINQGDVAVSGDEQTVTMEYAANAASYLLGFPSRSTTRGPDNAVLSDTKYFYDGSLTPGSVTKGNVTRVESWLNVPTVKWVASLSEYNNLGQVTAVVDAKGNRTETTYDAAGFPATAKNALLHIAQTTYDMKHGNLVSATDINNQTIQTTYDAFGRPLKVIGPLDTTALPTAEYDYHTDLLGLPLQQYTEVRTRVTHGGPDLLWSTSFIDGWGRSYLSKQKDAAGNAAIVETKFNNRGLAYKTSTPRLESPATAAQWTEMFYDALGRVIQTRAPDQTSTYTTYNGRTTSVQDANGRVQSSVVDVYGRVIQRNEPAVSQATLYQYDAAGNLIRVTDAKGKISTFAYDSFGRKLSMTDPNAGTWAYAYDDVGNLTQQTDARGVRLDFQYDALNRSLNKRMTADPSAVTGEVVGSTLAAYAYDETASRPYSKGKLTTITDASGATRFYHDREGRVERESKQIGAVYYEVRSSFNALGNLTQLTYPNDQVVKYLYDEAGRLQKTMNSNGTVTYSQTTSYDALARPMTFEQANGALKTTYTYDPQKQVLASLKTESNGSGAWQTLQQMSYLFDSVGNLTRITDHLDAARTQNFTYDDLYRLTQAQGAYGAQSFIYDELGNFSKKDRTLYRYDDAAHPYAVTQTFPDSLPGQDGSTLLAWNLDPSEPIYSISGTLRNGSGQPVAGVPLVLAGNYNQALNSDSAGSTSGQGTFQFRGLPGGTGAAYSLYVSSIGLKSAPLGTSYNPLSANQGNVDFTVTADTNPLNIAQLRFPRSAFAFGSSNPKLTFGTMTAGLSGGVSMNGGTRTYAGGWSERSGYAPLSDGADQQMQPPAQYILPPGAMTAGLIGPAFTTGLYQQALSFNGANDVFVFPNSQSANPTTLTLMVGVKPSAVPAFGFATLLAKSTGTVLGQLLNGYRLAMDGTGRVVFEIGRAGSSVSVTSAQALPLNQWTLITATYDGTTMRVYFGSQESANFATNAPVLSNTVPVTIAASLTETRQPLQGTFFQGAIDEPRVHNRAWSAQEILLVKKTLDNIATYAYDANGNCVTKTTQVDAWTYRFDSQGRMTQVKNNNVVKGTFVYDGDGGRVKKITDSGTTLYIGKLYEERPDGTKVSHVFANGGAGGNMICDLVTPTGGGTPQPIYMQSDHLGSASLVTNSTGQKIQEMTYQPFGEVFQSTGSSTLHHTYTGQESDPEIGLMFYNARYYDPVLGRFLSADALVSDYSDPQSFNRYSYVQNAPTIKIDPDGQIAWFIPVIAAAAMAGTRGNVFDRHAWSDFNWRAAVIAGAAAYTGDLAFGYAGGGFDGCVLGGAISGATSGGLNAAVNGGDVSYSAVRGMAAGLISGVVSGMVGEIPINAGKTGLIQTPLPAMAGSYVSTLAMGGSSNAAMKASVYAVEQGAVANFLGYSYDIATRFKSGPSQTVGSDKAYLMSRPLDIPVIGQVLAIFGFAHLVITNGSSTKELLARDRDINHHVRARLYTTDDSNNSYQKYGKAFGTTYQSLRINYSSFKVPTTPTYYNFVTHNSNTAVYNLLGEQ